ncbi:MAG: recombinase RecA [Bacteroidales bacterium]
MQILINKKNKGGFMNKEHETRLNATLLSMQKKYGKEAISIFGKNQTKVERMPVSSMNLTEMMGGGLPRGRMIEVYGPESSGKTSLATYFASECQKHFYEDKGRNGVVAFIDVEHAFDPNYASSFGLDMDSVLFSQPDTAEKALDMVQDLIVADVVDLIIIDSVASLVPQAELDGEMGQQQMGLQARLMSKACRKLTATMKPTSASIIWTNQTRDKIGVMYGNPETTAGGNALKFYAAIRFTCRRKENIEEGGEIIGIVSRLKAIKNKVAPPFKECEIKNIFGKGFQVEEEYVNAFIKYSLIEKSGSWFSIKYDVKGEETTARIQGLEKVVNWFMNENKEVFEIFKEKVVALVSSKSSVVVENTDEDENKVIEEQTRLEKEVFEQETDTMALAEKALGN